MAKPTVQLPAMPVPGDFNYDPRENDAKNLKAKGVYEKAVETWERVILQFAQTHAVDPDPPE